MNRALSEITAAAVRAVVAELRENPRLWGLMHLGPMLREHLPRPGYQYLVELRDALGLSGMGSLKDWGDEFTAEEVVKELTRLLGEA